MNPVWDINERTKDKIYTGMLYLSEKSQEIEWRIANIIKMLGKKWE